MTRSHKPQGNATVVRGHMYYAAYMLPRVQVEMDEMLIDNPRTHFVKHSAPTDSALQKKLWSFVTYTGESYGWYKGGEVYTGGPPSSCRKSKSKGLEDHDVLPHSPCKG